MVLMRRSDKRRGNDEDNIMLASGTATSMKRSREQNKGVRSMNGPVSGRFAADVRLSVGGYGRKDKTYGIDHPWHETKKDIFQELSQKDHMEEGLEDEYDPNRKKKKITREEVVMTKGFSRAAKRRMKAKQKKKQPLEGVKEKHHEEHQPKQKAAPKEMLEDTKSNAEEESKVSDDGGDASVDQKVVKLNVQEQRKSQKKRKKQKNDNKSSKVKPTVEVSSEAYADLNVESVVDPEVYEKLAVTYESQIGERITTPSGLVIIDEKIGTGKLPKPGESVTVKYRGRLTEERGAVFGKGMMTITFGVKSTIAGWEEGLATMRPDGKRVLIIPPELAYGSAGKGEKIPPESTLYFNIEFVRIGKRKRDAIKNDDMPLPKSFSRKRSSEKKTNTNSTKNNSKKGQGQQNSFKKNKNSKKKKTSSEIKK